MGTTMIHHHMEFSLVVKYYMYADGHETRGFPSTPVAVIPGPSYSYIRTRCLAIGRT